MISTQLASSFNMKNCIETGLKEDNRKRTIYAASKLTTEVPSQGTQPLDPFSDSTHRHTRRHLCFLKKRNLTCKVASLSIGGEGEEGTQAKHCNVQEAQ